MAADTESSSSKREIASTRKSRSIPLSSSGSCSRCDVSGFAAEGSRLLHKSAKSKKLKNYEMPKHRLTTPSRNPEPSFKATKDAPCLPVTNYFCWELGGNMTVTYSNISGMVTAKMQ